MPRFSLTFLLLISVVTLPWWVSLIFLISLILTYSWYYEGVLAILLYELLYSLDGAILYLTLATLLLIPIVEWLKKRLYVFY